MLTSRNNLITAGNSKCHRDLQSTARPKVKYQFIEQQRLGHEFPVRVLCEVLKVSESGYYAWRKRPPGRRQKEKEDEELTIQLESVFEQSHQTYGSPRIHAALRSKGIICSRHRIARLMRGKQMYFRTSLPGAYCEVLEMTLYSTSIYPARNRIATDII